jgi:hypothetical protein
MLDAISEIYSQKWAENFENGNAVFTLKDNQTKLKLAYNIAGSHHKFTPKFEIRPDFILSSTNTKSNNAKEKIAVIADAKYKRKPDPQDFERLFAYLLNFGWGDPKETVNGLFLYIGTSNMQNATIEVLHERKEPNAKIYSMCLRPNAQTYNVAKKNLADTIEAFLTLPE